MDCWVQQVLVLHHEHALIRFDEQTAMPKQSPLSVEDDQSDPDFVLDELAYHFPEHQHELPEPYAASWGLFTKARQVSQSSLLIAYAQWAMNNDSTGLACPCLPL